MEEKIDILLATYNGEKYVSEQIESILSQTHKNFNLIISDDNSTDNTFKILKKYEKTDKRIKVYKQISNIGYVKNFEFLLSKVESKYFMLSDQDDIWLETKVEKEYKKIKEDNNDLVFSDLRIVDEKLNILYKSFNKTMHLYRKICKYNDYRLEFLYNCITGNTIICKSSFIEQILPIPEGVKHDAWIGLIVSLKGKIKYLDEQLILYRQHSNNQIGIKKHKTKEGRRNKIINIRKKQFLEYNKNNNKFPDEIKILNKEALQYFSLIENVKVLNLRKISTFYKLYKNETFVMFILNFILLNIPVLSKKYK